MIYYNLKGVTKGKVYKLEINEFIIMEQKMKNKRMAMRTLEFLFYKEKIAMETLKFLFKTVKSVERLDLIDGTILDYEKEFGRDLSPYQKRVNELRKGYWGIEEQMEIQDSLRKYVG